jgi:tetratricopeptide (TPR) repeat protein
MRSGDIESAMRVLEESSEMITSDPYYDHLIALVYFAGGRYQKALEGLMIEVAINPGANYYRRAMVYSVMGDAERARLCYDSALEVLDEVGSTHHDLPHLHSGLALTYAGLGRREEAMRSAAVALELAPIQKDVLWNPPVCMDVAGAYVMVGEYEPAIAIVEDLLFNPTLYSAAELAVSRMLAPLHDYPRFQALLEKYEKER